MERTEELRRYLATAEEKKAACEQQLKELKKRIARKERKDIWEEYEALLKRKEEALSQIRELTESFGEKEPEWEQVSDGVHASYALSSFAKEQEADPREKLHLISRNKKALELAREDLRRTLDEIHLFEENTGIPRHEDSTFTDSKDTLSDLKRVEKALEDERRILCEYIEETKKKIEEETAEHERRLRVVEDDLEEE